MLRYIPTFIIFENQIQNPMSKSPKSKNENYHEHTILTAFILVYKHVLCVYTKQKIKDRDTL